MQRAQITLRIQITAGHFAELDCGNVMIMNLLPEVLAVLMQQQADFMLVFFCFFSSAKSKAAGISPSLSNR